MKAIALALLLGMAALHALAVVQQGRGAHAAWGYVAAFSGAATVGALADWFAVVALFRHPLGLRIPHTAIIAANKDRIGQKLAAFITTHFLSAGQIERRLHEWDAAQRLADWLAQPAHVRQVAAKLARAGRWLVGQLHDARVRDFITDLARKGLQQVQVAHIAAPVLRAMTQDGRHQQLLDALLQQLARLVRQPHAQQFISRGIAGELSLLKTLGLDEVLARPLTDRVVAMVSRMVLEVADDPQHQMRRRFDVAARGFARRLQTDAALQQRLESAKAQLLANPAVAGHAAKLWGDLLAWLQADLDSADSATVRRLQQGIGLLAARLAADADIRQWINEWLRAQLPALAERYRLDIEGFITARVAEWDAHEMADELERHVGRDLQFIRINGTLMGGLAGLCLHALTQWLR